MKTAIFPGSFDPITLGHQDIIEKSLNLFDVVIIGIGQNSEKKYMFSAKKRKQFVEQTFNSIDNIEVKIYENLIDGERGLPGYGKSTIYNVRWSHSKDSKASPYSSLSASVNLGSSDYFRQSVNQLWYSYQVR